MGQENNEVEGCHKFLTENISPLIYEKFNKSIRPIFVLLDNGRIEQVGTATLLKINGVRLLVTAAHVFDHFENGKLLISLADKIQFLHPIFYISEKISGERRLDKLDFAIQKMDSDWYGHIDEQEFIEEEDIVSQVIPIADGPHMCIGYPNSKNKKTHKLKVNEIVKLNILSYTGHSCLDPEVYTRVGCDRESHILVQYSEKIRYDSKLRKTGAISAQGLSGGPVVMMGIHQDADKMFNSQALGIVIEFKKREQVLICVRFSEIFKRISLLLDEMKSTKRKHSQ